MVNDMQVSSAKALNSTSLATEQRGRSDLPALSKSKEVALTKPTASLQNSARPSAVQNVSERYRAWSNLSEAQATLSRLQSMGETFRYTQDALLSLAREMTSKLPDSAHILHQITSMMGKLSTQTQIDRNFLPASSISKGSYRLDRINLLAPKDQLEKIQIRLPDSSQVNLDLGKGQSSDAIFRQISQAFRPIGIKAERSDAGALIFTGPDKLMDSAWIFQGQGVRVPAGSPVPVALTELPDPLTKLSGLVQGESIEEARQALRELLTDIGRKNQIVFREIDSVIAANGMTEVDFPEGVSSDAIRSAFESPDHLTKVKALITQANVSRENVVDILSVL